MMVFAAAGMECPATAARPRPRLSTEERLEEIAVIRIAAARAAEFEAGAPIGRRAKFLAGSMLLAQLIVGGALLRTLEHFVGLSDLLEARFGVLFLADVRVVFTSELAVSLLDLRLGGIARHPHDLVVILELHPTPDVATATPSRILCVGHGLSIFRCRRLPTSAPFLFYSW
jgi:hypothetical protein